MEKELIMNVIFLTISRIFDVDQRGIYTDLMRKFRDNGHNVYIVSPRERIYNTKTNLINQKGIHILGVKTLNIQKTNIIEKGIGTILLETQFQRALIKYLNNITFDLILYSTPPITFTNVVKFLKKKNINSISYLLLKDIFPQNAVDLEMFSEKSIVYYFFRKKEISLYNNSDYIGCMSPANVEYLLEHNNYIDKDKVEIAPNSVYLSYLPLINVVNIRNKYNLPIDKPIFIYGGNLGRPQGVDFLIRCLDANSNRKDCHFVIVGCGTERSKIERWHKNMNCENNITLLDVLPKNEYDSLLQSCDVGLIFLDHRFTIPNYPSRLLSYMEYKKPIISVTDKNTDIGKIAECNHYGFSCINSIVEEFTQCVNKYVNNPKIILEKGENAYKFLCENYLVNNTYNKIINHFGE